MTRRTKNVKIFVFADIQTADVASLKLSNARRTEEFIAVTINNERKTCRISRVEE